MRQLRSALLPTRTSRGLGGTAEDAGHAAHEGGLAAACACVRQGGQRRSARKARARAIWARAAGSPRRAAPAAAPALPGAPAAVPGHAPESAARPTTMRFASAALTTSVRREARVCGVVGNVGGCQRPGPGAGAWGAQCAVRRGREPGLLQLQLQHGHAAR